MHIGAVARTQFQSTPSVWRETHSIRKIYRIYDISIHSLRVEGDWFDRMRKYGFVENISIHSLRVEGDIIPHIDLLAQMQFQSTPSVWRETLSMAQNRSPPPHFNPLPPCGGRHLVSPAAAQGAHFNPLPPCGGRRIKIGRISDLRNFNPLPPCGGRQSRIRRDGEWIPFQSTPSVWRETPG